LYQHELYDVVDYQIVGDYTIRVVFDDGSEQVINLEPILYGNIYGPLRDLATFNQVRLDPDAKTLVWPNGADFDPETLHNWDQYKDSWIKWARDKAIAAAQKAQ
jgi:hypothetical protein